MAVAPQQRGLPTPPIPVMPPTGLAPVTQEVGIGAGEDAMSPAVMIQKYLLSRGFEPTPANVRLALEANARDPGVISGLRSDTAGTDSSGGRGRMSANTSASPPPSAGTSGTFGPGQSPIEGGPTADPARRDDSGPNWGWPLAGAGAALGNAFLQALRPAGNARIGVTPNLPPAGALPSPVSPVSPAQLPPPNPQLTGPKPPPEAPVAQPGSVIPQPGPIVDPNAALPFNSQGPRVPPSATLTPAPPNFTGNMPPVDPNAVGNYRPGPGAKVPPASALTLQDLARSILRLHK